MKWRIVLLMTIAAVAAMAACTQVSSDPNAVVALAFDSLPYPAVVGGDSLRDETGAVVAVHATPLNVDGEEIANAGLSYILLDTGATISAEGIIVATNPTRTSLRIVAQAGALQSRPLTLVVTPRPDSAALAGTVDTLKYTLPDGVANTSSPVAIRLLSNEATPPATTSPVRGWIVRYSVEHAGVGLSPNDTTVAWLVDESNRRSAEDTTGADGSASRRLRVNVGHTPPILGLADSLIVTATAFARGAPLAGTPIRVVIHICPRNQFGTCTP